MKRISFVLRSKLVGMNVSGCVYVPDEATDEEIRAVILDKVCADIEYEESER